MSKLSNILLACTALIAVSGCAKKRPAVLPPAPVDNSGSVDPSAGMNNGNVGGAIVPGSDADFQRSVSSNTVNFALDMYDIDPTARAILDSQAQWLAKFPNQRITIEGHADERGTREYNLALGDRRANATKNYLAARGVSSSRMTTISYGKERPVAMGSDDQSWAANRRAVTVVLN